MWDVQGPYGSAMKLKQAALHHHGARNRALTRGATIPIAETVPLTSKSNSNRSRNRINPIGPMENHSSPRPELS